MAGGQGSGIRMNEAEIARIVGGRSHWQDLEASIQRWRTDPTAARSITPEQDRQIRALISTVGQKLAAKREILDDARQRLVESDDPKEHREIVMDARKRVDAIDSGSQVGGANNAPAGASDEVYVKGVLAGHVVNGKYVPLKK